MPRPPIVELTHARVREFIREPEAVFWVFAFPLLLTLALGFAFRSKPPDRIPIGVTGSHAKEWNVSLSKSPALLVRVLDADAAKDQLRTGKISLLVEGDTQPVFRFDPTRPDARTARVEADDALQRAAGRRDVIAAREEHVSEQGSRYVDFLVPGLLGMNLMGTGMWGVGFSIVNARMKKLLKRLIATPMRKSDYLLAQFFSRLIFLTGEVTFLIVFAWLVFHVSVHGSLITFAILCLIGGFAFSGIGLLVSSRAATIEAVSGMMNLVMVPMWICSGVFFSYERFPDAAKPFIRALPLTALNDALRAVMNDGAGWVAIAAPVGVLVVWGVVCFALALRVFKWQ
jgi:ABC-type multidrug transport system permease subunit